MRSAPQTIIVLLVLLGLSAAFWWPALTGGQSLVHGDSIVHGLPLMDLHARALHGDATVLWSSQVYGGHPLFAESQGAFAHPLNLLLAWLVPPIYGHNLFHFLCMLIGGFGTFGLCRTLGASVWSAGFGALAVAFAPIWTGSQQNMSISGALAWTPWVLWAAEIWLQRLTLASAALLGAAGASVILAGYPQAFHGVAIYAALSLLIIPLSQSGRHFLQRHWRKLAVTGTVAVLFCVGLAAVQLLPLLELAGHSHRNEGVGLSLATYLPAYCRGFLFALLQPDTAPADYFPVLGSLLVSATASFALLVKTPARVKAHGFATLILIGLGMGIASPLFRLLYAAHLVPGLHFFRIMQIYLNIAVVGIAVLAAFAIDGAREYLRREPVSWSKSYRAFVAVALMAGAWCVIVYSLYVPQVPRQHFVALALAISGILILVYMRRAASIPFMLFIVLVGECVSLRLQPFYFGDAALLRRPAAVSELSKDRDLADYKFMDSSLAVAYAMRNPRSPGLDTSMQRMLAAVGAMSNLLWERASINGALALQTGSRAMLDKLMEDEIHGRTAAPAGQRAIDLLGVRYIAVDSPLDSPAFRIGFHDVPFDIWIMENTAAQPRFQTFTRYFEVESAAQALALLQQPRAAELIVERINGVTLPPQAPASNDPAAITFNVALAHATHYVVDVDAQQPGWLFLADANYPGWRATVDGQASAVYSAQLLGKAVAVPAGQHRVELRFISTTFRLGLLSSSISVAALLGILGVAARNRARKNNLQLR